jgi:hypothetical protein
LLLEVVVVLLAKEAVEEVDKLLLLGAEVVLELLLLLLLLLLLPVAEVEEVGVTVAEPEVLEAPLEEAVAPPRNWNWAP